MDKIRFCIECNAGRVLLPLALACAAAGVAGAVRFLTLKHAARGMGKILLGVEWNWRTARRGRAVSHDLRRGHITLIAPTGTGKGVTLEMPNLLVGLRSMSVLNIDPSGQNAAVCAEARRRMGHETLMLNPFNLHTGLYPDLADIGCNLLLSLDPNSVKFFDDAMALGDASITLEGDHQIHFPNSARGLMTWLMMFVRIVEGNKANLGTVRDLLTGDLRAVAEEAVNKLKHPRITNLAYKYTKETKELASVISTAETQSRWLESEQMRASLSKNGFDDFGRLKDRLTSLFLILPAGIELENHAPWLRMMVTCCLNALYRRGGKKGVPVLLMLSEFPQLGKLAPIRAAFGQARKYDVRAWPVLQDRGQLVELYNPQGAESFVANSACLVGLQPNSPETAEFMSNFSGREGVMKVNVSDDPQGGPARRNIGIDEERVWSAEKIRELPEFHGLVWKAGASQPTSVYLPPYWEIPACRRVARSDPFHPTSSTGGARRILRTVVRAATGAVLAAAAIAGFLMVMQPNSFGVHARAPVLPPFMTAWFHK